MGEDRSSWLCSAYPEARDVNKGLAFLDKGQVRQVLEHVVVARLYRRLANLPEYLRRKVIRSVVSVRSGGAGVLSNADVGREKEK